MTDERLAEIEKEIQSHGYVSSTKIPRELVMEVCRLRAGLEALSKSWAPGISYIPIAILAGADLRDPVVAEAVRQGTWRKEHEEVNRGE